MNVKIITKIIVPQELWATSLLPEGVLETWLVPEGDIVEAGTPVAAVRIEDCLHELPAPARGRLAPCLRANSVIEPGSQIGDVIPIA